MRALGLLLAVILLCVVITYVDGRGGRGGGGRSGGGRSGGGRSSSSSRGSSSSRSRSSSSRSSSSRSRGSSSRSTKYKSSSNFSPAQKKTMKKAALVGVGVYAGSKLIKAKGNFRGYGGGWQHIGYNRWDYDSWRDLASREGFLCRDSSDCAWLDPDLVCDDRELTVVPSNGWFGGSAVGIRGNCECREGAWWDDDELECVLWGGEGLAAWAIFLIVMAVAISSCCCCVCCVKKCASS